MQSKLFSLLATASFLFLLPSFSHAVFAKLNPENQSPFAFLKQLEGCRKGDKVKAIGDLKMHLRRFGYLSSIEPNHGGPQINFNDNIINGGNHSGSSSFHAVPCYAFFNGRPKWPPSKTKLTYAFRPGTRPDAMAPVAQAFSTWAWVTKFQFSLVQDYKNADLKISFQRRNHGDGVSFDGPGGVLAHAFAPTDGRLHFDGDENWTVGAKPGAFDIGTVGLHEIGHLLGLKHSTVKQAIMFPFIEPGQIKGLNDDDIKGIHSLYG
ncbi:LOW QUALITY PROTEIN: metalloendoproteinase 1-like [Herrania umbratica]|uniref:LOW QUALITY PROTEIN: metalloendoproteinase 1-like n=1 Tax=Herrania umbratica TaxID=108875 RepID=A0A6J1AJT8_9ROSI|nr:LOW QUALITY PROTEIN: metalloendoproteinase 1-like [Herrania umbratica]